MISLCSVAAPLAPERDGGLAATGFAWLPAAIIAAVFVIVGVTVLLRRRSTAPGVRRRRMAAVGAVAVLAGLLSVTAGGLAPANAAGQCDFLEVTQTSTGSGLQVVAGQPAVTSAATLTNRSDAAAKIFFATAVTADQAGVSDQVAVRVESALGSVEKALDATAGVEAFVLQAGQSVAVTVSAAFDAASGNEAQGSSVSFAVIATAQQIPSG